MKKASKLAIAFSAVTVAALCALAAPAVVSATEALMPIVSNAAESNSTEIPVPESTAEAEPVAEAEADAAPVRDTTHGDCEKLYYPNTPEATPRLDAPVDSGPREFAQGEVGVVDGIPTTYTVAPGDAIAGIGTRFCVFSTGLFYFNEIEKQGAIQPGDVLRLRP